MSKYCTKCGIQHNTLISYWVTPHKIQANRRRRNKDSPHFLSLCKTCTKEYNKNANTIKTRQLAYTKYAKNNKQIINKRAELRRIKLNDNYIKTSLEQIGISRDSVSPSIILLKRSQLILRRTIKNKRLCQTENQN